MKEAREVAKGEAGADAAKPVRPEVSAALGNYIALHRHAAVRASLLSEPGVALRLMVAHAIVGSPLWRVDVEGARAASGAIADSVRVSAREAGYEEIGRAECGGRVGECEGEEGVGEARK